MARLPRYFIPDVPLHVIQRGNNRQRIYVDDADRRMFLEFLRSASVLHGLAIHAYVLMPNHFHLLVTPAAAHTVARTLQSLGRRYVAHFNERHERTGTLWEGRYRATPIDSERYLFVCHCYIELNPVRASLVESAAAFRWSSHRHNAHGTVDRFVTPHPLYVGLGRTIEERLAAYRALFHVGPTHPVIDEIRSATHFGWALGGTDFRERIEKLGRRRSAPVRIGRKRKAAAEQVH